jgi:hypothetical protein
MMLVLIERRFYQYADDVGVYMSDRQCGHFEFEVHHTAPNS